MKYKNAWCLPCGGRALTWKRLPFPQFLQWFLSLSCPLLFKNCYMFHPYFSWPCTTIHHICPPHFSILSSCFYKMMKGLWIELLLYFSWLSRYCGAFLAGVMIQTTDHGINQRECPKTNKHKTIQKAVRQRHQTRFYIHTYTHMYVYITIQPTMHIHFISI